MKNKILYLIFLFIYLFSGNLYSIDKKNVIIQGSENIDKEVIFSIIDEDFYNIPIDEVDINLIIKKIYKTGLFKNVEITKNESNLIILLISQPRIENIIFNGNKRFKKEQIFELMNTTSDLSMFNVNNIEKFILNLEELYKSFGYNQIDINYSTEINNDKVYDLIFDINEGKISKINKVNFVGNKFFSNRLLLDQIKSKPRNSIIFFTKRNFKFYEAKNDTNKLTSFYNSNGFKNANIQVDYEYLDNKNSFNIFFNIDEGEKFEFSNLSFNINELELSDNQFSILNDKFEILKNKILENNLSYNPNKYEKIKDFITDYLFNEGLMFFNIKTIEKEYKLKVDVIFDINETSPTFINQINIVGNTRTLDEVIRRELTFSEGEAINDFNIQKSIKNLKRLNIFESVNINEKKYDSNLVNLDVSVVEKSTGDFQIGLSIGSLDGYTLVTGLNEKNIGGTGRNVSATINTSEKNTIYSFNVIEPHIFSRHLDLIYGFNYSELDKLKSSSYKLDNFNSNIGFQYDLTNDISHKVLLSYQLKKYIVNDITKVTNSIANSQGSNAEIVLSNSISYSNLNSFYRPTKGSYYKFSNNLSPSTNNDNGYIKTSLLLKKYYEYNKNILSIQTNIGNIFSLQNSSIDNDNKFSLGGRWLRGFDSFGAGPRESRTSYVGGNNLLVTKLDYSRPLLSNVSDNPIDLNLFTDIGKLFGNKTDPTSSTESIRSSYGFGFKFYSVIGPVGFSWAFPLQDESYDIKRSFLFTIGDIN